MGDYYPIIKIPDYIITSKKSLPTPKFAKPSKPITPEKKIVEEPRMPNKPSTDGGCLRQTLVIGAIGGFLLWIASDSKNERGLTFYGILLIVIAAGLIYYLINENSEDQKSYSRKLQKYHKDLRAYPILLNKAEEEYKIASESYDHKCIIYENDLKLYEQHLIEIQDHRYVVEHRKILLEKELKHTKKPNDRNPLLSVTKGVTEDYFFNQLNKNIHLGRRITSSLSLDDLLALGPICEDEPLSVVDPLEGKPLKVGTLLNITLSQEKVLQFGNDNKGYYPDIVIQNKKKNLFIDVEIDEPYIGATGEPIHYINDNDEKRDDFFLSHGWIVIRLAEEQIINYKEKCVNLINFIMDIIFKEDEIDGHSIIDKIDLHCHANNIKLNRWTKEEAHRKAFIRYRNNYLGYELSENLFTEINTLKEK